MRHGLKFNHLKRKTGHRKALLSHLASDLIKNKRIVTTLAKAKALRVYVEPLITKSKTNTTHQRRIVFKHLQDKQAVAELFGEISAKVGNRPGGYTRIIKMGARLGDAAEMALIELVDYNELYSNEPVGKQKKRRTRRGGGSRAQKPKQAPTSDTEQEQKATAESSEKGTAPESEATSEEETAVEKEATEKGNDTEASESKQEESKE